MRVFKVKMRLCMSLALLTACLAGETIGQAANPGLPVDNSNAPAKHARFRENANSRKAKAKAANKKRKNQVEPQGQTQAKNHASEASANEIAQLKQQLALQQKQISKLLHAVNQLQAEVAASSKRAAAAPVRQPLRNTFAAPISELASNAAGTSAAVSIQPSSDNEIASLLPVLPPQPGMNSDNASENGGGLDRHPGLNKSAQIRNSRLSGLPTSGEVTSLDPMTRGIPSPGRMAASPLAGNAPLASAAPMGQIEGGSGVPESPLQIHIGNAYVTPVGFLDFTSVWRNHDAGTGIGTNFGGIPYGNDFQNNLSEFRLSMQNSRVGFRVDAIVKGAHVLGYMESDFLGLSPGNAAVSSNSNSLRSRLYWVDVRKNKWEVLGGQTWSLITPGRNGISPLPGNLFYTQDMDVNYQLGLFWGRIPELRFVYHPSQTVAFAVALDNPEQYVGGSAGGGLITFPVALKSTYEGELNVGTNAYSVPNVAPDVIAKLAFDPSSKLHFEVGGVERNFKLWNPANGNTYSAAGGGGFVNLNFELYKGFRLVTNNFWSDGGGRYIFGQAPDLIVEANGSPSLIHASSTVSGFEYTHQNTVLFGYYGGLYIGRNVAIDANGPPVGYGYSGAPNSQNRAIQEGTFGLNQTIWKNPKWGAINLLGQYSYLTRNPWYVAPGQPGNASLNTVFVDMRYTLPGSAPAIK